MSSILLKGVIRSGRVEVNEPIDLPDGTEVTITGRTNEDCVGLPDTERPMTPEEIAQTLAAMAKVEPFEMTDQEREQADQWEKTVNDYTIGNMDKDIEDVFR